MSKLLITAISFTVLFVTSVIAGALGSHTDAYNCKYVTEAKVLVQDHEKYASAAYEIKYDDGTRGYVDDLDIDAPSGLKFGSACDTMFQWGFPFEWTNREVKVEPVVKES